MNQRNRRLRWFGLLMVGLIVLVFGLLWVNYQFAGSGIGQGGFIIRHTASRALLTSGINPYSDQLLKWFVEQDYPITNQILPEVFRLRMPLFSLFAYLPISIIHQPAASRAVWMMFQELMLVGLVIAMLELLDWSPPYWLRGLLLVLALGFYHSVQAIIEGGLVIVVTLLLIFLLKSIKTGQDDISGILLSLLLIIPSVSIGVVIFTLLWGINQKRFRILISFSVSLGILLGISFIVVPDWFLNYIQVLISGGVFNEGQMLVGKIASAAPGLFLQIRMITGLGLSVLLFYEWYSFRQADFDGYLWTVMHTLMISCFFVPLRDSTLYFVLFPGLLLILRSASVRSLSNGPKIAAILSGVTLLLLWIIFFANDQIIRFPLQKEVMFFIIPFISLMGLYWNKWWLLLPTREIWKRSI